KTALTAWRTTNAPVVRDESFAPLPGTRFEVQTLRRLVGESNSRVLLGSAASFASLDELAQSRKLGSYRLIHLATHGQANIQRPELSSIVLSRDKLPSREENERRAAKGEEIIDGHLRVKAV